MQLLTIFSRINGLEIFLTRLDEKSRLSDIKFLNDLIRLSYESLGGYGFGEINSIFKVKDENSQTLGDNADICQYQWLNVLPLALVFIERISALIPLSPVIFCCFSARLKRGA